MSNRLTRKAIKHDLREDEFRTLIEVVTDWATEHTRQFLLGAGALLAFALVAASVYAFLENRRENAEELLATAMKVADAPILAQGATPEDRKNPSFPTAEARRTRAKTLLSEVTGAVGAGSSADLAELYLAGIALEEGNAAEARTRWEKFLAHHSNNILATAVRLNLLRLERQQGNAQKVADELRRELDSKAKTLPEDALLFELAQALDQLQQPAEARELYQRILDEHPQSTFASSAREALPPS